MAATTAPDQKGGVFLTVWATHDFVAENEDELPFRAGEPVEVLEKDDQYGDGWWLGRDSNERVGLFPASFVTDIPPEGEGQAGEHESSYSLSGASEPRSVHSSVGVDRGVEPRGLQSSTHRGEGNESVDSPGNIELADLVAAAIAAARADGAPIPSDEEDEAKGAIRAMGVAPLLAESSTGRGNDSSPEAIQQEYDDMMREIEASRTFRPQTGGGVATSLRSDSKVTALEGRRECDKLGLEEAAPPRVRSPPGKLKLPPLKTGCADVAAAVENLAISIGKEEHDRSSPVSPAQRVDDRPLLTAGVTYGSSILAGGAFQQPKLAIPQGHPKSWSINDVYNWLVSRGFEADAASFAENEITGVILLELDLTTLKELGVTSFGKRFNMMHAVADLKEEWGLSIVTPVVSNNIALSTTTSSLGVSSEALDDSSAYVSSSGKIASTTSQDSGFRSEGRGNYLRRDSTSQVPMPETDTASFRSESRGNIFRRDSSFQVPMPEMDAATSEQFRRMPISSFYSSAGAPPPEAPSLQPVRRLSRMGSVASRPAPTPPRIRANDPAQKPHVGGGSHPRQPAIPARYSSVPGVDELRPATNLKAPITVSDPGSPVDPSPTASSSSSLRYLPKSERSNVFDSQERVIDYHRIDGTKFFNDAAHSGWLYKQRGALKTWKKLWFSIKGGVLFYQKHRGDRRVVGTVELCGYKIVPDANIYRGKYCWKAKHDRLRTHFFYTEHAEDMKVWVKHMIKATIVLDPDAPVISSYAAKTVPISVAQDMRPRPPNVTNAYGLRGNSEADSPPSATSAPSSSRRV